MKPSLYNTYIYLDNNITLLYNALSDKYLVTKTELSNDVLAAYASSLNEQIKVQPRKGDPGHVRIPVESRSKPFQF